MYFKFLSEILAIKHKFYIEVEHCTTGQSLRSTGNVLMFVKSLFCSTKLQLFDQKYGEKINIVKYYNLK